MSVKQCPKCKGKTFVKDTRVICNEVIRVRQCSCCLSTFNTREVFIDNDDDKFKISFNVNQLKLLDGALKHIIKIAIETSKEIEYKMQEANKAMGGKNDE